MDGKLPGRTHAEIAARTVERFRVWIETGDLVMKREVTPFTAYYSEELMEKMKTDKSFLSPVVGSGILTADRDGECVLLATYSAPEACHDTSGKIVDMLAHFDDGYDEDWPLFEEF